MTELSIRETKSLIKRLRGLVRKTGQEPVQTLVRKIEDSEQDTAISEVTEMIKLGLSQWPEFVDKVAKDTYIEDRTKALEYFWSYPYGDFVSFTRNEVRYYVSNDPENGELEFEVGGRLSTLDYASNALPADLRILLNSSGKPHLLFTKGISFEKLKGFSHMRVPTMWRTGKGEFVPGPSVASVPEGNYDRDINTTSAIERSKNLLRKVFEKKPLTQKSLKTLAKAA